MDGVDGFPDNQVCAAQHGQFIAFWRGKVVSKLDGTLRYFPSERAAREFLERRDAVGDSMVGAGRRPRQSRLAVARSG